MDTPLDMLSLTERAAARAAGAPVECSSWLRDPAEEHREPTQAEKWAAEPEWLGPEFDDVKFAIVTTE